MAAIRRSIVKGILPLVHLSSNLSTPLLDNYPIVQPCPLLIGVLPSGIYWASGLPLVIHIWITYPWYTLDYLPPTTGYTRDSSWASDIGYHCALTSTYRTSQPRNRPKVSKRDYLTAPIWAGFYWTTLIFCIVWLPCTVLCLRIIKACQRTFAPSIDPSLYKHCTVHNCLLDTSHVSDNYLSRTLT